MARRRDDDEDDYDDRPRRRREEDDEDDRPRSRRRDDEDDYDDAPRRSRPKAGNGMAVTALVLGILSLFCSFLTGIPAVIFGFLGLSRASQTGSGKGMAVTGMVLGLVGSLLTVVGGYFGFIAAKKGVQSVQNSFENINSTNNLRRVSLAGGQFHDQNGAFPRSFMATQDGTPSPPTMSDRLSWRVAILPQLDQRGLHARFRPREAWNSATNKPAADTYVLEYGDAAGSFQTRYRGFVGGGALFDEERPAGKGQPPVRAGQVRLNDITDGTSNTIFCVEAADTVHWAQHKELPFSPTGPLPSFGRPGADTFVVALCDGSARIVKKSVDPKVMRSAITRAGGEVVNWD